MSRPTQLRTVSLIAIGLLLCALGGCAAARRHDARLTGELLVAAGFTADPSDEPESAERLRVLPALTMVTAQKDDATVYRFADPYSCECVYVADRDAYAAYKRLA